MEKFDSKIVRLGELLRIAIPPEIANEIDLADHTPVTVFINEQGNIEIEIPTEEGAVTMCCLCGHSKATKKCINCGRHVCTKCFWIFGSLCKKCARRV